MHAPGLPCKYKSFGSLGGSQSSALGFQVLEVPATPMQGFKEPKPPQHFHDDRTISLGIGKSNSSRSTTPGLAAPCGLCLRKAVGALTLLVKQSVDSFRKQAIWSLFVADPPTSRLLLFARWIPTDLGNSIDILCCSKDHFYKISLKMIQCRDVIAYHFEKCCLVPLKSKSW